LALALVAVHYGSFDLREQPLVTDIRYFVYYAWQVAEGAVPHRDFFENKPQLSVLLGAGSLRIGEWFELDPLIAIRVGQEGVAAGVALLAFVVFRRLGGALGGFLGLAGTLAFGLLGALPAIGTLPKLAMIGLGTSAVLLAHDRRWFGAGLCGGLAFFDWQIGAAAWLAAAVAAGLFEGLRGRALSRVALGGAVAFAVPAGYYAANGALGAAFDQVVVSTFFRGATALAADAGGGGFERFTQLIARACPQHAWLFYTSGLGVPVAIWLLTVGRSRPGGVERARLLLPLCLFHAAILGISALEVQGYGDLFALLHTAAFGLGLLGWAGLQVFRGQPEHRRRALEIGFVAAALLVARPGPLRPELVVTGMTAVSGLTLSDQREVAGQLDRRVGTAALGALDASELLFLTERRNVLPSLYWNRATRAHFRGPRDAAPIDTVLRLVGDANPAFLIPPRRLAGRERLLQGWKPVALRSHSRRYAVDLLTR